MVVPAGISAFTGRDLVQSNQASALDSLMRDYGLANEMDIADHKNPNEQTIEQEYQTYVVVPLSPKRTNTLKFWEVCGNLKVHKFS
jgi:uncharacterized protein Usg